MVFIEDLGLESLRFVFSGYDVTLRISYRTNCKYPNINDERLTVGTLRV